MILRSKDGTISVAPAIRSSPRLIKNKTKKKQKKNKKGKRKRNKKRTSKSQSGKRSVVHPSILPVILPPELEVFINKNCPFTSCYPNAMTDARATVKKKDA